jgi:aspartyl protease family protein
MDGDTTARLIYLGLLLLAVSGAVVAGFRQAPGRTAQQALIWGFLFLGLVAVHGLWPDIKTAVNPRAARLTGGGLELTAAADGHYYVEAEVNGTAVAFLIDTGASSVVLTRADAARVGLDPGTLSFTDEATTANGTVATAPVRLERLTLGPYADANLRAYVNGGDLDMSLLGMDYLGRFDITFSGDRMRLDR